MLNCKTSSIVDVRVMVIGLFFQAKRASVFISAGLQAPQFSNRDDRQASCWFCRQVGVSNL